MFGPQGIEAVNTEEGELERLRGAVLGLAEESAAQEGCGDQSRIWAGARGELTPRELRRLLDHMVNCPVCVEAWRLACRLSRDAGGETRASRHAAPGGSRRAWWLGSLAAAAAVIALMVAGPWQNPSNPGAVSTWRDAEHEGLRSLVPDQAVSREDCVLKWAGPEGSKYTVQVATLQLEVLATASGLELPEYQVPEAVVARFDAGSRLLWQVTADLPDGRRLISETFFVRLQ